MSDRLIAGRVVSERTYQNVAEAGQYDQDFRRASRFLKDIEGPATARINLPLLRRIPFGAYTTELYTGIYNGIVGASRIPVIGLPFKIVGAPLTAIDGYLAYRQGRHFGRRDAFKPYAPVADAMDRRLEITQRQFELFRSQYQEALAKGDMDGAQRIAEASTQYLKERWGWINQVFQGDETPPAGKLLEHVMRSAVKGDDRNFAGAEADGSHLVVDKRYDRNAVNTPWRRAGSLIGMLLTSGPHDIGGGHFVPGINILTGVGGYFQGRHQGKWTAETIIGTQARAAKGLMEYAQNTAFEMAQSNESVASAMRAAPRPTEAAVSEA